MPSGELRFRLLKADGTAYIRTEAAPNGEWQNAHYHKKVQETYIVQSGWIGYAEWADPELDLYVYQAGESFTTKPDIVHNIYMPQGAVIHTVKHGEAIGEKRLAGSTAAKVSELTKAIGETELLLRAKRGLVRETSASPSEFGEVYRHFDNLIWQTAAWSSAVFALGLAGMTQLTAESPFVALTGIAHSKLIAAVCGLFGLFILIISHALYRFRWHQRRHTRIRSNVHWPSPQFGLQTMTNVQGGRCWAFRQCSLSCR